MSGSLHPVAGVVLTGGASRRMGADKAALEVSPGRRLAQQIGDLLTAVCEGPVLEVGPGYSGLRSVVEEVPGSGPLAAVATGAAELARLGWDGPALVLSCDLPCLDRHALEFLAAQPGAGAVAPAPAGRTQPLCARWSAQDLAGSCVLAAGGQRSLEGLPGQGGLSVLTEDDWAAVAGPDCFSDADTPADFYRLTGGLRPGPAPDVSTTTAERPR